MKLTIELSKRQLMQANLLLESISNQDGDVADKLIEKYADEEICINGAEYASQDGDSKRVILSLSLIALEQIMEKEMNTNV